MSKNIQIGIDLGTTNSEIATYYNGKTDVIKNIYGDSYTPSVFGIDKAKNKVVGKKPFERLYKDSSSEEIINNKAEIKRLMGGSELVHFERINLDMSPEEISAEILKSLKEDVLRRYPNINTNSAVITVPAYFSVLQTEATLRAGNLAGFKHVILLQEPIAAAISYGFMNAKNENWLVYDLGGGTFDTALISSNEGALSVVAHCGDNFLGGKDIDWAIVDKIIVPKLLSKFCLTNFNRGEVKYHGIFSKLKYIAESCKIALSHNTSTIIEIDNIGADENNVMIYLSFNFSREEFEDLIKPFIDRTIILAKQTITESGIKNSSINKIILVGGPTQIPYIRERLEHDLGIEVDTSIDPLTSVAHGASVFGISQKLPDEFINQNFQPENGTYRLNLNYESLTSDTDESISGIVESLSNSEKEYYIQIQSSSGTYSSTKQKLNKGRFFESVSLEKNRENVFWLYLFDEEGNSLPVSTESFTVTHGLSISGAPIPHSIGIAVVKKDINNKFTAKEIFERIFEKGSILPLKKLETFKTTRRLNRNEKDNPLWIRIGEGESDIPDRNTFICELGIKGDDLPYDLPEGTEIEIEITINESRNLFVDAYIPLIDLRLNARSTTKDETVEIKDLSREFNIQCDRAKAGNIQETQVDILIKSISACVNNAYQDEDDKKKANKELKELKVLLDNAESTNILPKLIGEYKTNVESLQQTLNNSQDLKKDKHNLELFERIKEEGTKAIKNNDKDLILHVNEQIKQLKNKIYFSDPSNWISIFNELISSDNDFTDTKEAEYYIIKAKKSIELGDIEELKRCTHNLLKLIPNESVEKINSAMSGITR